MNEKITFSVLKTDIKRGVAADDCDCPVARGLRRVLGKRYGVWVKNTLVTVLDYGDPEYLKTYMPGKICYNVPQELVDFIYMVDSGKKSKLVNAPYTFTIVKK